MESFIRAILANPTSLTTQLIFGDYLEEEGSNWCEYLRSGAVGKKLLKQINANIGNGDGGYGYGYGGDGDGGYGGDGYGSDGDGGYGGYGGYGGDGYGGYGGYGDGYGGYGDSDGDGIINQLTFPTYKETNMTSGYRLICVEVGSHQYTLVGELEINGMDATMRNGRVIRRYGQNMSLSELAEKGPLMNHEYATQLLPVSAVEEFNRFDIKRCIHANREVWEALPKSRIPAE